MGSCGAFSPVGVAYLFDYSMQAPLSLCNCPPSPDPHPDPDATGKLLTSIIDKHDLRVLLSRAWTCQFCGKPAKELYHLAILLFPRTRTKPIARIQTIRVGFCGAHLQISGRM